MVPTNFSFIRARNMNPETAKADENLDISSEVGQVYIKAHLSRCVCVWFNLAIGIALDTTTAYKLYI